MTLPVATASGSKEQILRCPSYEENELKGALDGLRVVDFGQYIAGPMTAMLLGDQGADVIRVDPPGGPFYQTPANATWNRNKKSMVLDLKQEADHDIARQLIETADVVIENFRPGVMDRLKLGAETSMRSNPGLIYCSMPGFAHDDPRAGVRAFEGVLGAATACFQPKAKSGDRPRYSVIPVSSTSGAFLAAATIGALVVARERTGLGERVEIPLFDATFFTMGSRAIQFHDHPKKPTKFEWSRPLPTKDGRWIRLFQGNKKFAEFLRSIGMDEYRDGNFPPEEIKAQFERVSRQRTAEEWDIYCAEIGTESAICHTSAEWLKHPHAIGAGLVADWHDQELGKFTGPGVTPRLTESPGSIRFPRAKLNEHRDEILKELAVRRKPDAASGKAKEVLRSALTGVKVLDLCLIVAGPTCGRVLAELGADVIKIDNPRQNPLISHCEVNRGKRTILLDLKSREGLSIFWQLLEDADVVLQNFRKGVAEQLGVGYESVRAKRPDIIYCSMDTYGPVGPFAGRPGHESIAQAVTGQMLRYGNGTPEAAIFVSNDYGTGLLGSYAVALALLHRKRTGKGQHVFSALAATSTILQSEVMQDYAGKQWDEPRGQDALGRSPVNRMYQAQDGWLFLAAANVDELKQCKELADLASSSGEVLQAALEKRIQLSSVDAWLSRLAAAGIGAHRVMMNTAKVMDDPLVRSRGLSVTREHDEIGPVTLAKSGVRLKSMPMLNDKISPKPGSDARSVLDEIGLAGELDRLIESGVVRVDGIGAISFTR